MAKILRVNITNFKKLKKVDKQLDGKSVYIIGANGTGKTSFTQAIFAVLTGKGIPAEPILEGEEKAIITLDIGDNKGVEYTATLKFTQANKKGSLTIVAPDGEKYDSPRKFLERVIGSIATDPFAILEMDSKKQAEVVKKMLGLDFADLDKEYDDKYKERATFNKLVKEGEGAVKNSGLSETDAETYAEEINTNALHQQLLDANTVINKIENARDNSRNIEKQILSNKSEIQNLQNRIADLEKANITLQTEKDEQDNFVGETNVPDIEKLTTELAEAEKHNTKHKKVLEQKSLISTLLANRQKAQDLTDRLEAIESEKKTKIKAAKIPIEGLDFTSEGLRLEGLPFTAEQWNKSKIIQVIGELVMATNKGMKVLRIEDGSLLDSVTLAEIEKFAKQNDYQIFIEAVDGDEKQLKIQFTEE